MGDPKKASGDAPTNPKLWLSVYNNGNVYGMRPYAPGEGGAGFRLALT